MNKFLSYIIISLLVGLIVVLFFHFVFAQDVMKSSSFKLEGTYLELREIGSTEKIPLIKKEATGEKQIGEIRIDNPYKISNIEENEFLDEFQELKRGFLHSEIDIEIDQPLFKKENFYHPKSLWERAKSLLGFETLPEYRITKTIDRSHSLQTKLGFGKIKIKAHYQELGAEYSKLQIKQTLDFTNESSQDLELTFWLETQVSNQIDGKDREYFLVGHPQKFININNVSFKTNKGKFFYDWSNIPEEFNPEVWSRKKEGQNYLILTLIVSLPAYSSKTIDPTYGVEITILNVHSHPQAGDYWTVSFETTGKADLTITPDDQPTIDDLDFISLNCGAEERTPQILENDVVFYPNWSCQETGEITHLVNVARIHTLKFQFGDQIAYAYNDPDSVPDYFSDTTYVYSTSSVVVSGGVAKLAEVPAFCSQAGDYNSTSTVSGDLVYCDNSGRLWTPTAIIGGSATEYQWGGYGTDEPTDSCINISNRPACNYCDDLNSSGYAGYADGWELPTCADDNNLPASCVLYQFGGDNCSWDGGQGDQPSCQPTWDTNAQADMYWASTEAPEQSDKKAWYVKFLNGEVSYMDKAWLMNVRCIRGQ